MPHIMNIAILAVVILLLLARRVKRTVGQQVLSTGRLWLRIVVFAVIAVLVLLGSLSHPLDLVSDTVGLGIGSLLAYVAIRTTVFAPQRGRWTYRPNPWIGLIVIALLIVRIGYRVSLMNAVTGTTTTAYPTSQASAFQAYAADPWTAGAFFILATYYIAYFTFLLQKERKLGLPDVV